MYSFSSETSVITVKEIENATKLFTEMCKEYENVQMKKIKKNMKLNKFELIRFALRAESTIFPNGRLDCINGNFHTEDAKEFMEYYKITYAEQACCSKYINSARRKGTCVNIANEEQM